MSNTVFVYNMRNIALLGLLFVSVVVSAQSLEVTTYVTDAGKEVKLEDGWHATVGAKVKFTLAFTPPILDDSQRNFRITRVLCEYNNETKSGELTNGNTFEFTPNASLDSQANCIVEYSYEQFTGEYLQDGKNQVPVYTTVKASETRITDVIRIYATPSAVIDNIEKLYLTDSRSFNIVTEGGSSIWKFSYNNESEVKKSTYTEEKPTVVPSWKTTLIRIINYSPDGSRIWYDKQLSAETYFYNKPDVDILKPEDSEFYKVTGTQEWIITPKGGGDNWTISWTGGSTKGNEFSYKPFQDEVTSAQLGRKIQAVVKSFADDGYELYNETKDVGTINVYPAVSHVAGKTAKGIYVGELVNFVPTNVAGGFPAGWDYSWTKKGDAAVISTKQQIEDTPIVTTTYTLTAKNGPGNGVVWDGFTEDYTVKVYTIPTFDGIRTVSFADLKGTIQTPSLQKTLTYPDKSESHDTYHLLVDDRVTIECLPSGGVPSGWTYTIDVDGQPSKMDNTMTFIPSTAGTYNFKITAQNGEGQVENPYEGTIVGQLIVYNTPKYANTTTEIHTFSGESETFHAPVSGGDASGWTYEWEDGTTNPYINLSAGSVASKATEQHTISATYKCEGFERFKDSETFDLVIWPTPKTTGLTIKLRDKTINKVREIKYFDKETTTSKNISIDCYDGDILDIAYSVEGGYTGEAGCWTYQKTVGDVVPISYAVGNFANGSGSDTYTANSSTQAFTETPFQLVVKNCPKNVYSTKETWLEDRYNIIIKAWHKPSITEQYVDSASTARWKEHRIDVYAGGMNSNNVAFEIPNSYGNTLSGGWVYSWMDDGIEVSTSNGSWTFVPTINGTAPYLDKTLSVHVMNTIGDNYGLDETFTYPIRIWNKALFADDYSMSDSNRNGQNVVKGIREGNPNAYNVLATINGYTGITTSNTYSWSLYDDAIMKGTSFTSITPILSGKVKNSEDVTDYLTISNYGPFDHLWDQQIIKHSYRVYQKPDTPESITKKGKFTTGTLAVSMPQSLADAELESYQYQLVFGYVDASGNDVDMSGVVEQGGFGDVRWYQVPQIARNYANYYVYAQWNYTDGAKVTSGKRYLNPVAGTTLHDEWDGSDYSNVNLATRGFIIGSEEATGVDVFSEEAIETGVNSLPFSIYTLNGKMVYPSTELAPGIYVVKKFVNGKVVAKKIFVK